MTNEEIRTYNFAHQSTTDSQLLSLSRASKSKRLTGQNVKLTDQTQRTKIMNTLAAHTYLQPSALQMLKAAAARIVRGNVDSHVNQVTPTSAVSTIPIPSETPFVTVTPSKSADACVVWLRAARRTCQPLTWGEV